MQATLADFLAGNQEQFGPNYEHFLAPKGGYPIINAKNRWSLAKNLPKDKTKADYYKFLAKQLVEEGPQIASLPKAEELIKRFNAEWMQARGEGQTSQNQKVIEILFNSKSKEYSWLSNLFETLILLRNPRAAIFAGAESAYKACKIFKSTNDQAAYFAAARVFDLGKAKRIEAELSNCDSVAVMERVVTAKFNQNPILSARLASTQGSELVEHTDHSFWGDGSSTGSAERGSGENKLGQLLMEIRDSNVSSFESPVTKISTVTESSALQK